MIINRANISSPYFARKLNQAKGNIGHSFIPLSSRHDTLGDKMKYSGEVIVHSLWAEL